MMKKCILFTIVLLLSFLTLSAHAESEKLRYFLFIGQPNAAAWKMLIEHPADREATMSKAIEKLGGAMLGYYWGLGDGKNYILIALPDDNELIQATYVSRLGDGLLVSYEAIELLTSQAMVEALKRVNDVKAVDDLPSK